LTNEIALAEGCDRQTVGYLLQAIERFCGISTNLPNFLNNAFNRRIQSKIRFEYPTQEQRVSIWQKNFPPTVPTKDLCFIRLSQVILSEAIVRKAAIRAALFAAADQGIVQMKHIHQAILIECLSNGRPLTDDETRGWDI
jgi:AAA+ superfamily predicted ATPase